MKWVIFFLFFVATPAFSSNFILKKPRNDSKDFIYFYLLFYIDTFYYTKGNLADLNIFVRFEATKHYLNSNVVGECFLFGKNIINIEHKYWESSSFFEKKILFYHELGHCFLDKKHETHSIMNSILLKEKIYKDQEYHFIHELFEN